MSENEIVNKILAEVEAYSIPEAPAGNPLFTAMYTAQVTVKMRILDIIREVKYSTEAANGNS